MPAVPTPLLEIDEALDRALASLTYYDEPPPARYNLPWTEQVSVETAEVGRATSGRYNIVTVARFACVVNPRAGTKASSYAKDVLALLNAYTWAFDGFEINSSWGSGLAKDRFVKDGFELHRVYLDYTWDVDYLL